MHSARSSLPEGVRAALGTLGIPEKVLLLGLCTMLTSAGLMVWNETPPLSGDAITSRYWLSASFQGLATLLALVISAALVAVQLAAQTYTHRVTKTFLSAVWFWSYLAAGLVILAILLLMQTGIREAADIPRAWKLLAIILSLAFLAGIAGFVVHLRESLQPRNIIMPMLARVDRPFMENIRRRYGEGNFAPMNLEENPILEVGTITGHLLAHNEQSVADVTLGEFLKRLTEAMNPDDYEAVAARTSSTLLQIVRVVCERRQGDILSHLCQRLVALHTERLDPDFIGTPRYKHASVPQVLLDASEVAIETGYLEGFRMCLRALGRVAEIDIRHLVSDKENPGFNETLRSAAASGASRGDRAVSDRAEDMFGNFEHLFVFRPGGLLEKVRPSDLSWLLDDLASYYRHIGFAVRGLSLSDFPLTRGRLLSGIAYNFRDLFPRASERGHLDDVLGLREFGTLAEALIYDGDFQSARSVAKVCCDLLLRSVDARVRCDRVKMAIVEVTVLGLTGLPYLPT